MALAVLGHIVELHAMRAFKIGSGFRRFAEHVHAHAGARDIFLAGDRDGLVALGNDGAVENSFQGLASWLCVSTI
jgi:hypothetical protein